MALGGFFGEMSGMMGGGGKRPMPMQDPGQRKRMAMADVLDRDGGMGMPPMARPRPAGMPIETRQPPMAIRRDQIVPPSVMPSGPAQPRQNVNTMAAGVRGPGVPSGSRPAAMGQMFGRYGRR